MSLTTHLKNSIKQLAGTQKLPISQENLETQLNEIASNISKDNLELGCKLIKEEVIEKALTKVREDLVLTSAIEKRKTFQSSGETLFRDESVVPYFQDLPQQLKPNPNGLTEA